MAGNSTNTSTARKTTHFKIYLEVEEDQGFSTVEVFRRNKRHHGNIPGESPYFAIVAFPKHETMSFTNTVLKKNTEFVTQLATRFATRMRLETNIIENELAQAKTRDKFIHSMFVKSRSHLEVRDNVCVIQQ